MNKIKSIFLRYILIFLIALPNFFIFYFVFTPLTIYPLLGLFKLFFKEVIFLGNSFYVNNQFIEIINACVAGSAYYFLFILNFSVPSIKIKKRISMILFSFGILLLLNIIRIFILSAMFVAQSNLFELVHKIFWYFGVSIFVILIWFAEVKIFKIKYIPIYSDIKYLIRKIK